MTNGLVIVAAALAVVFIISGLIKAVRRSERVTFLDVLLAFLVTLLPVSALLALDPANPDFATEQAARLLGLLLIVLSIPVLLLELRRPGRLRSSRGVLGAFAGLLLVISSFSVPFLSAWFSISAEAATQTASVATAAPESTLEVEGVVSVERVQAEQLFKAIRQVLAEEINASEIEVFTQLDSGVPLADIVEQHGGDVARVSDRLSELLRDAVRASAERGEISLLQGALLVSQMELFVRFAVNTNLNEFRGFGGPTPTGEQPSLLTLLTSVPAAQTTASPLSTNTPAATAIIPTGTPEPTSPPTRTLRPTRTPEPTRTPRPTRTPFMTPTPEATATASVTCFAVTNFNLRLRAAPNADADTLLTIPFAESIALTAQSEDGAWFETAYDGQAGWVAGEYLTPGPGCDSLETR